MILENFSDVLVLDDNFYSEWLENIPRPNSRKLQNPRALNTSGTKDFILGLDMGTEPKEVKLTPLAYI
jgi:hypothetical protein